MIRKLGGWLKRYFIPHEGNGHKPHFLRPRTVAFLCMVALVAEGAFLFSSSYIVPHSKLFGLIEANALVDETNQQRATNGDGSLTVSPLLQEAAQKKANDMAANGYFAHTSPAGLTPWYWFEQVGYQFSYAGENLAVNFSDSQDVTNAWMNSPEHRANILNGEFTEIGIATAQGTFQGKPAIFVVQLFGTPASAPVTFVNEAAAATAPAQAAPQTATASAPAPVATRKPAATTAPARATVPAIVPTATAKDSAAQPLFVAVKGAQQEQGAPQAATSAPAEAAGAIVADAQQHPAPAQSNLFERLLADPKNLANDFYYALMALFLIALGLNTFIKIRVQFPRLILGGMMMVVISGLLVLFNQNVGLLHAAIL